MNVQGHFDLEGQGNKIVYCELVLIILVVYEESSSSKNEGSGWVLLLEYSHFSLGFVDRLHEGYSL